jgi:hypothetical protein
MSGFAWDETAGPGLVLHFRTTSLGVSGEDVRNETQTTYYGESAMRSVSAAQDSILFFSKRKFVSLNHQAKTYSELTFEEMERTLGGLADGAQSAETLEAMRQVLGDPDQTAITHVGPGGDLVGFPTEKYLLRMPPNVEMEIWAAPQLELPPLYFSAMQLKTPQNPLLNVPKLRNKMQQIKGISLKTVTTVRSMGVTVQAVCEVTAVERKPLPASTFEIPAGYSKVEAGSPGAP